MYRISQFLFKTCRHPSPRVIIIRDYWFATDKARAELAGPDAASEKEDANPDAAVSRDEGRTFITTVGWAARPSATMTARTTTVIIGDNKHTSFYPNVRSRFQRAF